MLPKYIQKIIKEIKEMISSKNIAGKAAYGTIWLGTANGFEQLLRFIRNMILTRILLPEAFGVMAIILAANNFLESFTEVGIKQALIQNPRGKENTFLNGAWFIAVLRSIFLYSIAYFLAPVIAGIYDNPDLILIMRIAFLSILFKGFMSIRAYVAVKEMNFKQWVFIQHGGGALGIILAIILAFYLKNIWALVLGFTAESAFRFIFSYILSPYLPALKFDKDNLRSIIKYAMGMLGLPILTFIFMRIDVFVIGKLCSEYELGLYSMAVTLALIPLQLITVVVSEIAMPAFSKLQNDNSQLNKALLEVTGLTSMVSIPLLILIYFYSSEILTIVYGKVYSEVAIPFMIISTTAIIRLLNTPIAGIYLAIGKPELHRYFAILRAILIIILIYPAVKWFGLTGAALAGFVSISIGYFVQIKKINEITKLNYSQYYKALLQYIQFTPIIIIIWFLSQEMEISQLIIYVLLGLFGCIIVYGLSIHKYLKNKNFDGVSILSEK